MIRFHLDENVDHAAAQGLRQRGIDVTTSTDAGLIGATDEAQLAFALAEQRVLVTHDRDILRLHAAGAKHSGIAYCHLEARLIGEIIRNLCLINDCLTIEESVASSLLFLRGFAALLVVQQPPAAGGADVAGMAAELGIANLRLGSGDRKSQFADIFLDRLQEAGSRCSHATGK